MLCRDRLLSLCDVRGLATLLERFAARGLFSPGSIGAGKVRRRSRKRRSQEAPVPWAAVRPLRAECGRPFDGGDEARCRRNPDAVRTHERLDESAAACVIAWPAH